MKTFESYLLTAYSQGITEFRLSVKNPNERMIDLMGEWVLAPTRFYIHPEGKDGETLDLKVQGNELGPDPTVSIRQA